MWQGRGATVAVTGGFVAAWRLIESAVRPVAFGSDNQPFVPPTTPVSSTPFADPWWGNEIDVPYRFGNGFVTVVDPGESYVRLRMKRTSLGVTTESQHWGPAHHYPLLLGTQAAGYPRAFIESRSIPVWLGRLTAHWQLGFLEASRYTDLKPGQRSRISSSALVSFQPRGLEALELGAGRFFHIRRIARGIGLENATLPFSGILKSQSRDSTVGGYNQLASIFFRLAPAPSGIEVFGEFFREDHNADLRDLIGEPDHASAYTIGLRRTILKAGSVTMFSLEHANARISHLVRVRSQGAIYTHSAIREGHTYRGQPLGTFSLLAGGGTTISWGRLNDSRSAIWTYEYRPIAQNGEGGTWNGTIGGWHSVRYDWSAYVRRLRYSVSVELEVGEGSAPSNARTILSFAP